MTFKRQFLKVNFNVVKHDFYKAILTWFKFECCKTGLFHDFLKTILTWFKTVLALRCAT